MTPVGLVDQIINFSVFRSRSNMQYIRIAEYQDFLRKEFLGKSFRSRNFDVWNFPAQSHDGMVICDKFYGLEIWLVCVLVQSKYRLQSNLGSSRTVQPYTQGVCKQKSQYPFCYFIILNVQQYYIHSSILVLYLIYILIQYHELSLSCSNMYMY